jgi:crotonobetainyl-CoA:carnitine CoA-transferase CaiB-like acyl-CoA transferase
MLDMGSPPEELKRSGNEHRQFIPVNAYPTRDGYVYLAIGSDAQWDRLVGQAPFAALAQERFATNEGRRREKGELHRGIEAITAELSSSEVSRTLAQASIPHAPITPVENVMRLPFVESAALHTVTPDGRTVRLPPPAVSTPHLEQTRGHLPFAPGYGEHTRSILAEVGLSASRIEALEQEGVVA